MNKKDNELSKTPEIMKFKQNGVTISAIQITENYAWLDIDVGKYSCGCRVPFCLMRYLKQFLEGKGNE